ncbi:MAG: AAA family ATPase [Trichlorobacter sp.]|nr:AAA family ATPase [Trichlorobacter sp.]
MCKKIFIAATGQHCGKTTISLSLMHLARQKYKSVGFMKPIGPKCIEYRGMVMDKDAAMMAGVYNLHEDVPFMSPMTLTTGSTRRFLDGIAGPYPPRKLILDACAELEKRHDFLIIEGAGHGGVGSVVGTNNAQVAAMLEAPVLMITGGGIGNVIDSVELNLPLYERENAQVKVIMANKLIASKREDSLNYLKKAFADRDLLVTSAFDYSRTLADPTLQHVADLLQLELLGNPSENSRICHNIQIGAASSQKVIEALTKSTLLIVTSSRDELIVTATALHHIPEYREKIAGLIISGHTPVSEITHQILESSTIPYMRIEETTTKVYAQLREHVSKIGPEDTEKIDLINAIAEKHIDFEAIDAMLG